MRLLRFVIALALPALMGMIGLGAAAYAGVALFVSTTVISRMSQAGEQPPLMFLLQHFGFNILILLGGIGLLVFGALGIVRRVRRGLPTDEEGVGTTTVSRLLNILLYGAGFCFGAYSLAVSIVPGAQMALLVANGVTTEATITGFEPTADPKYWIVKYRFSTKAGQVVEDTTFEDGYEKPTTRIMSKFKVTYMPSDPAQHDVTESYSHSSFVLFMVLRLGIALVGLWGLVKNIGPMLPRGSETGTAGETPPGPQPRPRAPSATLARQGGAKATFGRRGA